MKTYITIALCLFGIKAFAVECQYNDIPRKDQTYVIPVYEAQVRYNFDNQDKKAFATVFWSLSEEKTKACFNIVKSKFPNHEILIPKSVIWAQDFEVMVYGNENPYALHIIAQANGHWNGMTDTIQIPYSKKAEIQKAIQNGTSMIEVSGRMQYQVVQIQRKEVTRVKCTEKGQLTGVLNLLKRMNEVQTIINKRDAGEAINKEEVMQNFLGSCVMFAKVDAKSFKEFEDNQRLNSQIVPGDISVKGDIPSYSYQPIPNVSVQNNEVIEF